MNTDSPNGPGPERLICRVLYRPARTDRGGALVLVDAGLIAPPAGADARPRPLWRRPSPTATCRCGRLPARPPAVRHPGQRAAPWCSSLSRPDCAAYYRQLGGCPWPPGTTPWGRRVRHRADPQRSVHPQAHRRQIVLSRLTRWRTAVAGQPAHRPFGRALPGVLYWGAGSPRESHLRFLPPLGSIPADPLTLPPDSRYARVCAGVVVPVARHSRRRRPCRVAGSGRLAGAHHAGALTHGTSSQRRRQAPLPSGPVALHVRWCIRETP